MSSEVVREPHRRPIADLGVNARLNAGFDIYTEPGTGMNHGFATISTGDGYRLYGIDVLTGSAVDKGAFPKHRQVTDLAMPVNQK
ncbi:DUF4394 domain-containing protein [Streptomyces sp. NPDC016459]|uniref:DUF4394 domain-containing protein n=1 Tax=Streptomyces sp. NPDC016459 TaxID=3157190 RepID=UPI0033C5BFF0